MSGNRVLLCQPGCPGGCPAVEISQDEVTIGETGNLVKLTPEQWNLLVEKIKSAELPTIKDEMPDVGYGRCCGV